MPAASIARTRKLWRRAFSPRYLRGEAQGLNLRRSSLHSKLDPGSLAVKRNFALVFSDRRFGERVILVCGGWESGAAPTAHSGLAGFAAAPTASGRGLAPPDSAITSAPSLT